MWVRSLGFLLPRGKGEGGGEEVRRKGRVVFAYPGVRRARAVIVGDGKGWRSQSRKRYCRSGGGLAAIGGGVCQLVGFPACRFVGKSESWRVGGAVQEEEVLVVASASGGWCRRYGWAAD